MRRVGHSKLKLRPIQLSLTNQNRMLPIPLCLTILRIRKEYDRRPSFIRRLEYIDLLCDRLGRILNEPLLLLPDFRVDRVLEYLSYLLVRLHLPCQNLLDEFIVLGDNLDPDSLFLDFAAALAGLGAPGPGRGDFSLGRKEEVLGRVLKRIILAFVRLFFFQVELNRFFRPGWLGLRNQLVIGGLIFRGRVGGLLAAGFVLFVLLLALQQFCLVFVD